MIATFRSDIGPVTMLRMIEQEAKRSHYRSYQSRAWFHRRWSWMKA